MERFSERKLVLTALWYQNGEEIHFCWWSLSIHDTLLRQADELITNLKGKWRKILFSSHPAMPSGVYLYSASMEGSLSIPDTPLRSSYLCLFWTRPFATSDNGSTVSFTAPSGERSRLGVMNTNYVLQVWRQQNLLKTFNLVYTMPITVLGQVSR